MARAAPTSLDMSLSEGDTVLPPSSPESPSVLSAPPPPGTGRPGAARRWWPIVAVVVVAIVVLAYFALGDFGPGGSGKGGNGSSFATAEALANRTASSVAGGPWQLVTALGYAPATEVQASANSSLPAGCNVTSAGGGLTTSVVLPAFDGSFSSGQAPWWGMIYYQATTAELLLVDVVGGIAAALLIASGTCVSEFQKLAPIPSDAEDSPAAASAAWGQGGSAFVSAHSNLTLNLEIALIGGGSYEGAPIGPSWLVEYSPCLPLELGGPTGTQPAFEAVVNALTGGVTPIVTSITC